MRIICAEDKDTIPPIGFEGRAGHTAWTGACLLFGLEQISGFFHVHIVSVYISIEAIALTYIYGIHSSSGCFWNIPT